MERRPLSPLMQLLILTGALPVTVPGSPPPATAAEIEAREVDFVARTLPALMPRPEPEPACTKPPRRRNKTQTQKDKAARRKRRKASRRR